MTTPSFPSTPQPPRPGGNPANPMPPADYSPAGSNAPGQPPSGADPLPGSAPPVRRSNPLTSKPVIGIAALVVGLALGTGVGGGGDQDPIAAAPAPAATVTATTTVTAEPPERSSTEPSPEPSPQASTGPAPEPSPTEEAKPAKKSYKTLSSRAFKLMAKDPDAHIGKAYVIYGEITQFDSATGTDTFRADTGPKKLRISYGYVDYDQNSILTADESKLKKLVEGDCFKAKVTVLGSFSYDTQIGGSTTVPMFSVDSISVYGSTD